MPEAVQVFCNALPFTKLVDAMQDIMTRNLPFDAVVLKMLYLAAPSLILFALGTIAYRLDLKRALDNSILDSAISRLVE